MLKKGILARYCEKRKKKDNTYANFRILSRLLITFWKFYNMKSLKFFYPNYLIQYKYNKEPVGLEHVPNVLGHVQRQPAGRRALTAA